MLRYNGGGEKTLQDALLKKKIENRKKLQLSQGKGAGPTRLEMKTERPCALPELNVSLCVSQVALAKISFILLTFLDRFWAERSRGRCFGTVVLERSSPTLLVDAGRQTSRRMT